MLAGEVDGTGDQGVRDAAAPPPRVLFVTGKLAEPALRRVLADLRPAVDDFAKFVNGQIERVLGIAAAPITVSSLPPFFISPSCHGR